MEKMSMIYDALLSLHAEMVLDQALREFRLRQLYEAIDEALQYGDEATFLKLTDDLRALQNQ
ncbi:IDEAL domain-containing protein [Xylanibacillus composti]|uniref:IDEAL domain-containing protein n=1 Tax=Xylanibacillus composti TaxID=1572762 RepID=A0A8J4GYJ6_9BACL|nr:IDEAL domain-containing protein [Xylanibacillus composti]MDT9725479.1 IDEAL domain-containing protein [Xylanibacillus composti]GIQ67573.1 hypothetical protein XYCOK13_03970 [Xylanibacillus composti]